MIINVTLFSDKVSFYNIADKNKIYLYPKLLQHNAIFDSKLWNFYREMKEDRVSGCQPAALRGQPGHNLQNVIWELLVINFYSDPTLPLSLVVAIWKLKPVNNIWQLAFHHQRQVIMLK